jgi:hypothetical protein
MDTEIVMVETPWAKPLEEVTAAAPLLTSLPHGEEVTQTLCLCHRPPMKSILDEYVGCLRDNPKVYAVYATEEHWGIRVWTYVDSNDRKDRSPVYAAEWQLLSCYPDVRFDFNVLLSPAGSERFEAGSSDYIYTR